MGNVQVPEGPDLEAMAQADREYRAASEERQMAMMNEMEDKRAEREQAEINRQDRVRENEENALETLENSISENSEAVTKFQKDQDKDVVLDFYNSLASGQGQGKRPE